MHQGYMSQAHALGNFTKRAWQVSGSHLSCANHSSWPPLLTPVCAVFCVYLLHAAITMNADLNIGPAAYGLGSGASVFLVTAIQPTAKPCIAGGIVGPSDEPATFFWTAPLAALFRC